MAHTVHGPSPCKKISVFWRYSGGCTTSHISPLIKNIKGTVYTFARVWMSRRQESCGRDTFSIPIDYCPFSIQQNLCGLWYTHQSTFKWRKVFCIVMYHGLCVPLWSFLADRTKKVAKIWLRHISTLNSSVWSEWVEIFHIGKSIHISSNEDSCCSLTLSIHQ